MIKQSFSLIPRIIGYNMFRNFGRPIMMPMNYTLAITNVCNSRCKTCFIWNFYNKNPKLKNNELTTEEFQKLFKSIGRSPVWVTISGGEPFIRNDLSEICIMLNDICHPQIVNIPTNSILADRVINQTKEILKNVDYNLVVNLSLDNIDKKHDEIRGTPGNFNIVMKVYKQLKELRKKYDNFQLGIHSVISNFNIKDLSEIYEFVRKLNPDSYITEIAEERSELFNFNKDITPNANEYTEFIEQLITKINRDYLHSKRQISKVTQSFRIYYYKLASEILKQKRQVIPCFAGVASCQISPFGDVWPCCVLGYNKSFGNLREVDFDFKKIWKSKRAEEIRKFIKNKKCYCPLANAHYTNMLCNLKALMKITSKVVKL